MIRLNFQEGDIPALHPHLVESHLRGRFIGKALFEGLTRINAEGEAELAGAESVHISTCQTEYTFTLRDHHWSDGTPVSAFQYERAWKQAIAPASDCGRADLFYIIEGAKKGKEGTLPLDKVGIKALDNKTLHIKLNYAAPFFLKLIASPIFAPVERAEAEPAKFNGPFIIDTWKRNNLLVLRKNFHFWDHDKVSLERIEVQMVDDPFTALLMYEKRKIDWIGHPFCQLSSEMAIQLREKQWLRQHPIALALWIYLNNECPTLSSIKVRQSLSLAIDRSLIAGHIFPYSTPLYKPLPLCFSLCSNSLSDNNISQSKHLFEAGLKEIELPKELLPTLTLSYPNTAGHKQLAEYLQEIWGKVLGINISLKGTGWNVFRSYLEKGEYQLAISGMGALYADASEPLERFELTSPANFPRWRNPAYQEKLGLARKNPQKRACLLGEAEQLLMDEMPFIPICNFDALFAHIPQLKGYIFDHVGCLDLRWAYLER
ncbi:MAG: peptide ABC transporter substrate-binding protein [Chlamydiales bacterium]